jgi:hypothetical protein
VIVGSPRDALSPSRRCRCLRDGDDTRRGGSGGDDVLVGVAERRFQEGEVADAVHDATSADQAARSNRPQEGHVNVEGRLELVGFERG